MRVTTVNVNGIRAALRKGMADWVDETGPDVLLMQEVRAPSELVEEILPGSWNLLQDVSQAKGRAGVAIGLSDAVELKDVRRGLPEENVEDTGRWIEADVEIDGHELTLVSAYLHSGVATKEEKMTAKYRHLDMVSTRLAELADEGRTFLVAGDFNVVRGPADIKNFKPNHNKTSGVLDREMAYLEQWFESLTDVHRELAGDVQGPYTWWSQRGQAFDNDAGWRIDYQMTTPNLGAVATSASVGRASSYDTRWSDHAPVTIDYDLDRL